METHFNLLQSTLQVVSDELQGSLKAELLDKLHNHEPGMLPDLQLLKQARSIIDLMGQIERLIEPSTTILADHFLGYLNCKCLCAAVELNIPDLLARRSTRLTDLANACDAKPQRLRQVLRVLHNNGIFDYDVASDTYSNNHTSELLLSAHWTQWRNWVDLYGNSFYDMARGIPSSLASHQTRMAAQINYDTDADMFSYFASQGWIPKLHRTLGGGATAQAPGILEDYPWQELSQGTVLDVGGGEGALLALILAKHPTMTGALLDTERVITHAKPLFLDEGGKYAHVRKQMPVENFIVGDFLERIPTYEFYTMKWCLHDWDDSKAIKILTNIRAAIKPGAESRLVVLESILAEGKASRLTRYADLTMMISANGQERTRPQWEHLAETTGWKITRIFELRGAWPQAIELRCSDQGQASIVAQSLQVS